MTAWRACERLRHRLNLTHGAAQKSVRLWHRTLSGVKLARPSVVS